MELELVIPRQKEMEILSSGQYALMRYRCPLPDSASEIVSRSIAALQPRRAPAFEWWRNQSAQLQKLGEERQELVKAYARLGRWQDITLGLGFAFEAIHGVIALAMPANVVDLAPVGGSALAFGGAFVGVLRYLAKERAATMGGLVEARNGAAKFQGMAEPMVILPQMMHLSDDKFRAVAKIYHEK